MNCGITGAVGKRQSVKKWLCYTSCPSFSMLIQNMSKCTIMIMDCFLFLNFRNQSMSYLHSEGMFCSGPVMSNFQLGDRHVD